MRNTLREGLAVPALLANPFRPARKGRRIGEGRPVLVIPGLATGDISTLLMRRTLRARGFAPCGWHLAINHGADLAKLAKLEARLAALHSQTGRKVVVVGWSLGGLYARILGQRVPEHVASVITVGSPFSGGRRDNAGWRYYELINDHTVDDPPFAEDFSIKPPVPTVAIWSAIDGIVAPHSARGLDSESDLRLQVDKQHFALGTSRRAIEQVITAITMADALS